MIVTIDGPAGSGKSTAARGLADRLGFCFLDTGAMYRVVALKCIEAGVDLDDPSAVARHALSVRIQFEAGRVLAADQPPESASSGLRDVTAAIRTAEVTRVASIVAQNPRVREAMVRRQRELAEGLNIVTEGRDQGTVAFPEAECKFFLVADARVRALRRRRELEAQGDRVPLDELTEQIEDRDRRDAGRAVGPLRAAPDAERIDTSQMSAAEVLDLLERRVRDRMASRPPEPGDR